jgi:hypothetical protein
VQCYRGAIEDMHLKESRVCVLDANVDAMLLAARSLGLKTCIVLMGNTEM